MSKHERPRRNRSTRASKQKTKNAKRHTWLMVCLIAVLLTTSVAAGLWFASSSLFHKKNPFPKIGGTRQEELLYASDKAVILIMGVDQRDADDRTGEEYDIGRSDTLMVAMLDPNKDQASLLSIPRDTRVRIKGLGWDKINSAYPYGGKELTRSTVEKFLGTPMDHYVLVNTHNFPRIIDAIGGVDIDVEKRMQYEDPWDDNGGLVINLFPGMQHMDGKTAITYVRYRDEEGDIGRVRRQQKFMKAAMEKVTSPSIIPRLPSIIREMMSSIETDMSFRQLLELAGSLKNAQRNGLRTTMLDGKPAYIDGVSYWIPDISDVRDTVAKALDVRISSSFRRSIAQEEAEYDASLPANIIYDDEAENERHALSSESRRHSSTGPSYLPRPRSVEEAEEKDRQGKNRRPSEGKTSPALPASERTAPAPEPSRSQEDADTEKETEEAAAPAARPTAPASPSRPVSPQAGGKKQY